MSFYLVDVFFGDEGLEYAGEPGGRFGGIFWRGFSEEMAVEEHV